MRVNGIVLGDPTPLIHGDKVEIAGRELQYADDTKVGATQFVSAAAIAAMAQRRPGGGRATAATGGRVVSLVDGKEYTVPDGGIVFGRDAVSDVVVAQNEVSRKHAEVMPVENGYVLRDLSANGVFVNGVRVDRTQLLARADVIRIGTEEFRFYADIAPAPSVDAQLPAPDRSRIAPVDPPSAPTPPMAAPAALAAESAGSRGPARAAALSATMEFTQLGDARPVLASLQVINEGPSKGHIYTVHVPLAHVGRGAHNDVVIADESVSDTHAKLQRRDDGWYLVDVGSTNGTYVGGQRIAAERRLEGAPDVRFGGVKMVFRANETRAAEPQGHAAHRTASSARKHAAAAQAAASAPMHRPKQGIPGWLWIEAPW